jgi:dihydrodipicolinate synthase/N-acetylneuraminate lyase
MLLEGMHLPLTTPYQPDGRLNLRKLEDNVKRYSKTPAAGLVVLARSGQPTLLSDAETREALRTVVESAAAEKVLIAGVARDSVDGTLELIAYAAGIGYDAALVPVPSILRGRKDTTGELLSFYRAVADRAALPVVLESGVAGDGQISLELVVKLAQHPNVIGAVDTDARPERIEAVLQGSAAVRHEVTVTSVFAAVTHRMLAKAEPAAGMFLSAGALSDGGTALSVAPPATKSTLKTRTRAVGFQVLCGRTAGIFDALQAGAVGAVPPLAASAPQVCYEVLAAWKDGDPALAAEKQERLRLLSHRVEEELGVAGIKFGCDLNGYFGGRPRLPILPLTGAEREEIEGLMAGIRN